jgi:exopolysaccharide biosynthesis predicted pyruvyltransferase EpsI
MLSEPDRHHLESLRAETTKILSCVIGDATHVAVLDFPSHDNVGDSMIWAGQAKYLTRLGCEVAYTADWQTYHPEELRQRHSSGPILLAGGGNFGDLWPWHQQLRERVARDFPARDIVIMPQSVQFEDERNAERANATLGAHGFLTLLVREEESRKRCERWLPDVKVQFCPDTAFGYDPPDSGSPRLDYFALARTDSESTGSLAQWLQAHPDVTSGDWSHRGLASRLTWLGSRVAPAAHRRGNTVMRGLTYPAVEKSFDLMLRDNLAFGRHLLGQARIVITDRLHAHVLCALLGIPHVVLDNNYGKISSIVRAYSGSLSTVTMVDHVDAIGGALSSTAGRAS